MDCLQLWKAKGILMKAVKLNGAISLSKLLAADSSSSSSKVVCLSVVVVIKLENCLLIAC